MDKNLVRSVLFATLGLLLVGAGFCLTIEAGFQKHDGAEMMIWFKSGTIGLVVFMSGLSIFGKGVIEKTHYERKMKRQNRSSKN